ncbi:blastula protease 10-like [Macrobrachium nipponense]|uniref:blastula protease 10-like n=1 Tax=Macrobrachium nipponense TaxID=159736 RepID=UPI0030C856B1
MAYAFLLFAVLVASASAAATKNVPNKNHPSTDGDLSLLNPTSVNGTNLYETDILLTDEQHLQIIGKKAISNLAARWPTAANGFIDVPYRFGDANVDQTAVAAGIAHWEANTCIRFRLDESQTSPHIKFILGSGCWSYIGRINSNTGQDLSIGTGCTGLGTVAHEIGHSMGFYHEQSRSDRDSSVKILLENIIAGKESNFNPYADNNYSVPYDYLSDMHYSSKAFSSNGKLTIATVDPMNQELIGARSGLSHMDLLLANKMYPCIEKWLKDCSLTSDPCMNYGYMGANCSCVCPPGTTGTNCETVEKTYFDTKRFGCSEIIHPMLILLPLLTTQWIHINQEFFRFADVKCTKAIEAPACHKVQLTFTDFQIYGRNAYCNNAMCCYFEILEIRTNDTFRGDIYCDTDIAPGTVFESAGNKMILYFESRSYWLKGWSANIKFIPIVGCDPTSTPTCTQNVLSATELQWTSPLFGQGNYPDASNCSISLSTTVPAWAKITVNSFALETGCSDYVTFTKPYNFGPLQLCDTQTGSIMLPSYNTAGTFLSSATKNAAGFDLTITKMTSSCHKVITLTSGGSATLTAPTSGNQVWTTKACEWWIESPVGTKIKLTSSKLSVRSCSTEGVLINPDGNSSYPTATTNAVCGTFAAIQATSNSNKMAVMFYSNNAKSSMSAKATVVAA